MHEIAQAAVDYLRSKPLPPATDEVRSFWEAMLYNGVISSLVAYDELCRQSIEAVRFFCRRCMRSLKVPQAVVGKRVKCPKCGAVQPLHLTDN